MDEDRWLTTGQVAMLKNVTREAVRRAIAGGRLAGEQHGHYWLVRRSAAEAWKPQAGYPKGRPRKKPQE